MKTKTQKLSENQKLELIERFIKVDKLFNKVIYTIALISVGYYIGLVFMP